MHSTADVLYHPVIGRWLFSVGILFFLLSGPMLVFGQIRAFFLVFSGGLAVMGNAFLLLYADKIAAWLVKVPWTDPARSSDVSGACCSSAVTLLLSLIVLHLTLQGRR